MIEHLTIRGFKSFENVELELGPVNLFIGTNSSGKSNLFDALRVLQGIGYGLTVDEIFNGKPEGGNNAAWKGIRGGGANAGRSRRDGAGILHEYPGIGVSGMVAAVRFEYSLLMSPLAGSILNEELLLDGATVPQESARGVPLTLPAQYKEHAESAHKLRALFANCQHLDPSPAVLRQYSWGGEVLRMGERGENFAALVKRILADPLPAAAYRSWLQRLTPKDLEEIVILRGALEEPLFGLRQRGVVLPAPVLSDGTLRFAALTAAFFQPDMPNMLVLEEIENGIHPSRLRLLVELLKSRSSEEGPQVMASTHSPVIVDWLQPDDMKHCFLCRHDEETGVSTIQPLSSIPRFMELTQSQSAGELFVEGWMETPRTTAIPGTPDRPHGGQVR